MKLDFNLQINQKQGLALTAQVQQAIKLLHMTNLEISEFVETQFQDNPFVEVMKNKAAMHVVTSNPLGRSTKVNLMSDFSLAQPGELRRRLVSVKAEMKRLSNDAYM